MLYETDKSQVIFQIYSLLMVYER